MLSKLPYARILLAVVGVVEMDQEDCMALVQPLLTRWHDGWHYAHDLYRSYPPELSADHDDSTAAACVRRHMWVWLQNNLMSIPGVNFLSAGETRQLDLLNYQDRAVVRFKKVDSAGRHSNFLTGQQGDFDREKPLPGIPPEAVRLTCGYEPAPSGEAIRRVIVARVFGPSVLWASQVNVVDDAAAWEDITPARIAGTNRIQERPRKAG